MESWHTAEMGREVLQQSAGLLAQNQLQVLVDQTNEPNLKKNKKQKTYYLSVVYVHLCSGTQGAQKQHWLPWSSEKE